jgi:two-component system, NtrC family, response regulator HydG
MAKILLIDDDQEFSKELRRQLQQAGHEVRWLDDAEEGMRLLAADPFDLILLDNLLGGRMSGLEFLAVRKQQCIGGPPVILMTGAHDADTAIQATKMGAFGYVIKLIDFDAILPAMEEEINRALKIGRPIAPVPIVHANEAGTKGESAMIGRSKPMLAVFQRIGEIEADESVLILGETGTGKDLAARAIHTNSTRKSNRFVAINCAAIAPNLLESELFGHEKGAFTGADKMRKGFFEHAHGGTLFLDEVGDMPLALQVKLLRVLQNREITRMGSVEPIDVDVRVLAATSRDLRKLVFDGTFRQDLFFRLEGATIRMPPLRERKEDVELLAKFFLNRMAGEGPPPLTLHPDAVQTLRNHLWPGNIRQLENVMRRARRSTRARWASQIMPEDLDFGEFSVQASPVPPFSANEADSKESAIEGLRRAIAWAWQTDQGKRPWPLLQELLECELLRFAMSQPHESEDQLAKQIGIVKNTLRDRKKNTV